QDWLMEQGYMLNKKMIIPPYSENLMEFPTNERGNRFIERQILQPGLICANGITKCDKTFTCLVINLTADAQIIKKIPELVKTAHSNKEELKYLGHVVTAQGVKPDPNKIQAVTEFPTPKTPKDIKSFLGLAGYYRKFIEEFSAIAKPLTELLKKDKKWKWEDTEQNSFNKLKDKLTTAPLLQYPDFTQTFKFQVVTDHKGLVWLFKVKDPSSRLIRWKLQLSEFEFEIHYRAGKRHVNADSLSRHPVECCTLDNTHLTEDRKKEIIKEFHSCPIGGHLGINKTTDRIKLYITWPGVEKETEKKMKLHNTWVTLKMLIPFWLGKLTDAQEVKALDSKTGVYFDEIGIIQFYPIQWKVGDIAKILFGTLTQSDAEEYNKHISQLEKEQAEFLHYSKGCEITVIKSTINSVNLTIARHLLTSTVALIWIKLNDYEKLQLDMPMSNLMSSVDDLRMASMKADDLGNDESSPVVMYPQKDEEDQDSI
ncbi:hypothetical protein L9F63_003567, partial [Diploptera punctata]